MMKTYQCSRCLEDMQRHEETVMNNGVDLACPRCQEEREQLRQMDAMRTYYASEN